MSAAPVAILAANRGYALASSRRLLVEALLEQGWRVVLATAADAHARELVSLGAELAPVVFARSGAAPRADLAAFRALRALVERLEPRLVHCFHAKPVILGGLAAASSGASVVHTITGLGQAFVRPGLAGALTRRLAALGYGSVLPRAAAVIFQNPDDRELFLDRGWVSGERSHLVRGSGVDLERFAPPPEQRRERDDAAPRVLMAARLLWPKGVREFVDAARQLRATRPGARFQIAGELDPEHAEAVPEAWLREREREGTIELLGYREDLERVLAAADVFALPSYYREGVPRVALEAAACALPVVAADAPGSRETVVDGETGRLVPPRDANALAAGLAELLDDPALARRMGRAGRRRVEREFDLRALTVEQLALYRRAGAGEIEPRLAAHAVTERGEGARAR